MNTQGSWRGIGLVLAAVFLFACQDALGKYLFATYSVPFVHAVRYFVNLGVMVALILFRRHQPNRCRAADICVFHFSRTWGSASHSSSQCGLHA